MLNYEQALSYVKENGKRMGQEAQEGSVDADAVIAAYKFVYACPGDPGGQALFSIAVDKYIQSRKAPTT